MEPNLFRKSREQVEQLCLEARQLIDQKATVEADAKLKEAQASLDRFRESAEGDVQERSVQNLSSEISALFEGIDDLLSKREAGKTGDGNIALKCNWNDRGYCAPCSDAAYELNVREGRIWCRLSGCREHGDEVSLREHPCYESIALKEMYFGAGWDHTGGKEHPRHVHHVRTGRAAILTTRPPATEERDRLVIGVLLIDRVDDDPGEETRVHGDKEASVAIPFDEVKVRFWDHYKNPGAEDIILWASGLFRYVTNGTVMGVLKDVQQKYAARGRDTAAVDELCSHYEELVGE